MQLEILNTDSLANIIEEIIKKSNNCASNSEQNNYTLVELESIQHLIKYIASKEIMPQLIILIHLHKTEGIPDPQYQLLRIYAETDQSINLLDSKFRTWFSIKKNILIKSKITI